VTNCLAIKSKFGLTPPPAWWLKLMHAYDDQLVIFPSQKDPVFRLGRKSRLSAGIEPSDVPGVENHPDTVIMRNHGLVPVTTVVPGAIWDVRVFNQLAERDTWRMGGATEANLKIEAVDEAQKKNVETKQADELHERSVDAYAAYRYRTGSRVSMAHKGASNNKPVKRQYFDREVPAGPSLKPFIDTDASIPAPKRVVLA
jgi:hypothetical protein